MEGQDADRAIDERREGHMAVPDRSVRSARTGLGQRRNGAGDGKTDTGGGATGQEGTTRGGHVSSFLST
jgi:hypothetical protein